MLKKNKMELTDFPRLIKSTSPEEAAAEMAALRTPDKSWIGQTPLHCSYNDLKLDPNQNRYVIEHDGVPFETLYMPKKSKKLYVMFSGGGSGAKRRYPLFLRWKYQNYLDGAMLCFDDPMYHFHPEMVRVMWYYGTKEKSYLHLLIDVVKKAMQQLHIKPQDVTFIGSSGGGYTALYCCNLLDNSSAIAMNPQVILREWDYPVIYNNFQKWDIDLDAEDPFGRNRIQLTNKTSHFMLILNANSRKEFQTQFMPFAKAHGITPTFGISQHGNILTWIHATDYREVHSANPEKVGLKLAAHLLEQAKNGININDITTLSYFGNELLYEKFALKDCFEKAEIEKNTLYKFFIHSISRTIEEILYRKIPMQASEPVRKLLDYKFEISKTVVENRNIGYFIGEQRKFRYNIFYHKGNFYFRLKFGEFSKHFKQPEAVTDYLDSIRKTQITNWYIEGQDTLVTSLIIQPETAEQQIADFVDLTLSILKEHLA